MSGRWFATAGGRRLWIRFGVVLLTFGAFAPSETVASEPTNLDHHKDEVRRYVDSGEYLRDISSVAAQAKAWITERAGKRASGERLAVVFDLDETLLSNLPFMLEQDLGGSDAAWDAWLAKGEDPAIEPVRDVYRVARRMGVEIIFITSRREHLRTATVRNLRAIDCGEFATLVMKPEGAKHTSAAYKTAERARLAAEGYVIIANIGDQFSDLAGAQAERTFKLPDPFYFTS